MKLNKPLYELARPQQLEDVVLEPRLYKRIVQMTKSFESMPHLVLFGPPGTGKTTTARAIAKRILGVITDFNYLQLNASVDRGVEVIRSLILKFVSSMSFAKVGAPGTPYKMVFLDEADALTPDAQNALRNMMQTYAATSRFILSCNNESKIIPALVSRCLFLEFKPLQPRTMTDRILKVASKYGLNYSPQMVEKAVLSSKGDFRVAFNNLASSESQQKDYTVEISSIVNFIRDRMLQLPLSRTMDLFKMKKALLEAHHRLLFQQLVEMLCELKKPTSFALVDRLARTEHAILTGASAFTQFMGWVGYYYSLSEPSHSNLK